jgi:hypothetical protein
MRSPGSTAMHTALESPVAYSSFFLSSSVSVSKPSYAAPSAFEVGISSYYEDEERLRDSMSWTRASTFDERTHAESDLVNVSSMDFSPTEQEHTMIGHSPVNGNPWPDFYATMPPMPQPPLHPQAQGATRVGLPFPLVPLKSSPATTTPFQSAPSGNARRKPRSSSFFNPIRLAFPPRHPSSSPSVPARRSAPASPNPFPPPVSPIFPKSAGAEFHALQPCPGQEHTHGRRRHRQPLRSARDWILSSRLFAAAAA